MFRKRQSDVSSYNILLFFNNNFKIECLKSQLIMLKRLYGPMCLNICFFKERVAELEQSEAALKCQIINLENQLVQAKSDLATAKTENDDLGEHCNRLENCLGSTNGLSVTMHVDRTFS